MKDTSLDFPRLVYVTSTEFKKNTLTGAKGETSVFKLDWDSFDERGKEKHKKWNKQCWPDLNVEFVYQFPEEYEKILKEMQFAIPSSYMIEIKRQVWQSRSEWSYVKDLHFDTSIRESCLAPSISHTRTAFYLLADCAYDKETNYYDRRHQKILYQYLMLYRFWQHQTGRGMIGIHSGFDRLEKIIQKRLAENPDKIFHIIRKFLTTFKCCSGIHHKKLDEAISVIYKGSGIEAEKNSKEE